MTENPSVSRHERRRLQTRNQLIQTTLQLVLEKGYDAITIQDITDRADLGRGTFYIHFKDKADVVWAAMQDMMREIERDAHNQFDPKMPQVEYFGLRNIFLRAEQNKDLYRVVLGGQGSAMLAGRAQEMIANLFLYDIQRASHSRNSELGIPDEILAQMLTGVITRLLSWWLDTPNAYSAVQMAALTYKMLYRRQPPS
jgi:AcrR family transcriptional regulator